MTGLRDTERIDILYRTLSSILNVRCEVSITEIIRISYNPRNLLYLLLVDEEGNERKFRYSSLIFNCRFMLASIDVRMSLYGFPSAKKVLASRSHAFSIMLRSGARSGSWHYIEFDVLEPHHGALGTSIET